MIRGNLSDHADPGVAIHAKAALDRLFAGATPDDRPRAAAWAAVLRRLCVVSGGPGTGKTTTAAAIVALLVELGLAAPERIALAAPTGKAAARLQEAVRGSARCFCPGHKLGRSDRSTRRSSPGRCAAGAAPVTGRRAGQLGAALLVREEPADALTFVCLDRRLSLAAEREGLRVATPACDTRAGEGCKRGPTRGTDPRR